MKKIAIILLAVLIFVCGVCLVACDNSKEVLDMYIFEKEGQQVSGEFTLPRVLGESVKVTWTSDNENLIKITDRTAEDRDFLATVTRPESVRTEVKLTVTAGKNSKTFSVYVAPYDVYDFSSAYRFKQDKATVTADFDLDSETKIGDKTANIAWSVDDADSQAYIAVEGNKCKVTPSALDPQVYIKATFTYQGKDAQGNDKTQTTTKRFRMTVSRVKNHLENVDYWYNNTNVSVDIKGYVAEIATPYDTGYKNVTLYIVDENFDAGYYVYRVGADPEEGAKIKVGAYVTITGTTNTNYNGLIETNAGGTLKVDESKNMTAEDLKAKCYALDNDLLGKVPSAIFHTSQYVSLSKWKVTKISDAVTAVDNKDLFVIEKNGVKVTVRTSKYLAGAYSAATDKTFTDIVALQKTLHEGDIISIKGMLGNNKGYTILPISASDVTVETAGDDDAAIKAMPGVKVGAVISKLNKVITDNNLDLIVTKAKTVTLTPSDTANGVTVKYSLLNQGAGITLTEAGVLTIPNPTEHNKVHVQAEFTCGEYKTYKLFYIEVWNKTDAEMVADEKLDLYLDTSIDLLSPSVTPLQTEGTKYGANVEITWAIKDASNTPYATIDSKNNLVISTTTIKNATVTIVATIKVGSTTDTKEFTFEIPNVLTKVDTPVADKAYKLVMDNTQLGKSVFATNGISGFYIASVDDIAKGGDVYVEQVTGGHKIYFLNGTEKVYIGACTRDGKPTNTSYNITLGGKIGVKNGSSDTTDPAEGVTVYDVWTITDECIKINLNPDGENWAFIGTYGTNVTFSMSKMSYLAEGNYAAYLADVAKIADLSDEQIADYALSTLSLTSRIDEPSEITLSTISASLAPATVEWSIKETTTAAIINNGKLVVSSLPSANTQITVVATVKVGTTVTKTKEFPVTISKAVVITKVAAADLQEGKAYKLIMDNTQLSQSFSIKNSFDGYYIASDVDITKGADVYVETVTGGGYKIYFLNGTDKVYIGACTRDGSATQTSYNLAIGGKLGAGSGATTKDPAEGVTVYEVWQITDECIKINLNPDGENYAFIGNYNDRKTFALSAISNLTRANNYAAYLAVVE